MTWRYQIMRHEVDGEEFFQIHEVYLDNGKVTFYTKDAISAFGNSIEELIDDLKQQLSDAEKYKNELLNYKYDR